jgi:hypothetical protein
MYATGWVTLCRNVSRIEASGWVTLDQNSNFFRIAKGIPSLYRITLLQNHWVTLGKNMHLKLQYEKNGCLFLTPSLITFVMRNY